MILFSIPSDFKLDTVNEISQMNEQDSENKIIETYGQMTVDNIFPSGRPSNIIPSVDYRKLKDFIQYSKKHNLSFNYTLNAAHIHNMEFTDEGVTNIIEFLKKLESCGVDSLTVSLPSLFQIIKASGFQFQLKASAICQINTVNKALQFQKIGVDRLVIDESITRNIDLLQNISKALNGQIELIVNSVCSMDCIFKSFHYNSISCIRDDNDEKLSISYYSNICSLKRRSQPEEFLKLAFIRPEDIHYYNDLGITHFKLQGRQLVMQGDVLRAVKCYYDKCYDGNLLDLLFLFSPISSKEISIDNRKMDNFFDNYVAKKIHCKHNCVQCHYCMDYYNKYLL